MTASGVALAEWVDRQPISTGRLWWLIAVDCYRCALETGQVTAYLDGDDVEGLVRCTACALPLLGSHDLHPADLLYLPQIHHAARQSGRQLTGDAYDGLAAALYAALVEHGVPTEVRQPVREDLAAARDVMIRPSRPDGHPYLWPRPGRCSRA